MNLPPYRGERPIFPQPILVFPEVLGFDAFAYGVLTDTYTEASVAQDYIGDSGGYDGSFGIEPDYSGLAPAGSKWLVTTYAITGRDKATGEDSDVLSCSGSASITDTLDATTGFVTRTGAGTLTGSFFYDPGDFGMEGEPHTVTLTFDGATNQVTSDDPSYPFSWYLAISVVITLTELNPYKYHWKICPAPYCFFKLWWKEVRNPFGGDADVTDMEFETEAVSVDGFCIPSGVDLTDDTTWPTTPEQSSDDQIDRIDDQRWSLLANYTPRPGDPLAEPPVASPDPNDFPF